jgi:sulfoacetaldehyde dehydrogenase
MFLNPETQIEALMSRARYAQSLIANYSQTRIDQLCYAAGWALMMPERNRMLAEMAVAESGFGNVADKIAKNHRKTLGLLRDIANVKTVGVISDSAETGITEVARPIGVIGAITPSTNPCATPANNIINALKGGNAIILSPSPRGEKVCAKLIELIYEEFDKISAPHDLVQMIPAPGTKVLTYGLMGAVDLVLATGSQSNVRAAYSSGKPALGVGAGNVASIIDNDADLASAAQRIALSKCFDNSTSCSSENSLVIVDAIYDAAIAALVAAGGRLLYITQKESLERALFPGNRVNTELVAKSGPQLATYIGLSNADAVKFLIAEETGIGDAFPLSGEKLSPAVTVYRASDFGHAARIVTELYAYQGAGHSVGYHGANNAHISLLARTLPVARVIVNQPHAIATGGSFENGLPFSLSMGCGSWGKNSFSDNLHWRHFINTTRIVRPIPANEPSLDSIFEKYWAAVGK